MRLASLATAPLPVLPAQLAANKFDASSALSSRLKIKGQGSVAVYLAQGVEALVTLEVSVSEPKGRKAKP